MYRTTRRCLASAAVKRFLRQSDAETRNNAVTLFRAKLKQRRDQLFEANLGDCTRFADGREPTEETLRTADQMYLTALAFSKATRDLDEIVEMRDWLNSVSAEWETENKVSVKRVRAPVGSVLVAHGVNPADTIKYTGLVLKSGNAGTIKPSASVSQTSEIIAEALREALHEADMPEGAVSIACRCSHDEYAEMLKAVPAAHDLVIAIGSKGLHAFTHERTTAPVVSLGPAVTYMYIHVDAEPVQVTRLVKNAKLQAPLAFNAVDHILVHEDYTRLGELVLELQEAGTVVYADKRTRKRLPEVSLSEVDRRMYRSEFRSNSVTIRTVSALDEAVAVLNHDGSPHASTIVTRNDELAAKFQDDVDAVLAFHNTSPRFADSEGLALGPGFGVAASGPYRGAVSIRELFTEKYVVSSIGRTRPDQTAEVNPVVAFGKN
ncbi:Gamma-glutamyl phosphate reductase [Diplonema papillatum]|nr:Gamma-glutamyl phosphate reductase [Diplonema papillatum]|eukprot:gene5274-8048_t